MMADPTSISNDGKVVSISNGHFAVQLQRQGKERFIGRFEDKVSAESALAEALAAETRSTEQAAAAQAGEAMAKAIVVEADETSEAAVDSIVGEALRNLVSHVVFFVTSPPLPAVYSRPAGAEAGLLRLCRFGAACNRTDPFHWMEADHPADHPRLGKATVPPTAFSLADMPDCRHWTNKGCCGLGPSCRFTHTLNKRGSAMVLNHRERLGGTAATSGGGGGGGGTGKWRQRGRRNGNRGAVFRRFLIDTFGFEELRKGSGVLDVAGGGAGGGGLAFSLLNYSNIQATVIDPRPPVSRKAIDTLTFAGNASAVAAGSGGGDGSGGGGGGFRVRVKNPLAAKYDTDVTPRGTPPRLPPFVPKLVEEAFAAADALLLREECHSGGVSGDGGRAEEELRQQEPRNEREGAGGTKSKRRAEEEGEGGEEEEEEAEAEGAEEGGGNEAEDDVGAERRSEASMEVKDEREVGALVEGCSVVCGLHPDSATEPAVDWALERGKPFAVVPCCVFWRSRVGLLEAGVRSYEDFLRHLEAKRPAGEIRRSALAFDGRNTVLWWPGPDDASQSKS